MTEAELLDRVRTLCRDYRLTVYHTHDSRRSEPGFPDLVICGYGIYYRELKGYHGQLTPDQARWGRAIIRGGGNWKVWNPDDWLLRTIHRELDLIRALPDPALARRQRAAS